MEKEYHIEENQSYLVLHYKNEDFMSFYREQNDIRVRKINKSEKLKKEKIYSSDIYIMLFDEYCSKNNGVLYSDKYVSEEAKKMWIRIQKESNTNRTDIVVDISEIPYSIKKKTV